VPDKNTKGVGKIMNKLDKVDLTGADDFMNEPTKKEETKKEDDVKMEDEVKLPKLDGAPVENTNLSAVANTKNKNTVGNYQESFLNRLYNN
jgi:hypothetical protein